MIKINSLLLLLGLLLACATASADIVEGPAPGSIVLREHGREVTYGNVLGEKDSFDRSLISLNGLPGLKVSARYDFYYTLVPRSGEILIDCAYFDVRNIYNGARASAGMCGLNVNLSENYGEISQGFSNNLRSTIYSFNTAEILESSAGSDFLLGKIGKVEIFDRYPSVASLLNSSPQKLVKSKFGCFNFGEAVGFLVFFDKDKPSLEYLDIQRPEKFMTLQRMDENDLKNIAIEKCF